MIICLFGISFDLFDLFWYWFICCKKCYFV